MNSHKLYLAPMEEVTGFIFRNALCEIFGGVDKYFAPFISPTQKKILKTRERRDMNPSNNKVPLLIPQILTAKSDEFLETVKILYDLGYREINFNAGCPSATVTRKGKGSGFLENPVAMKEFFTEVFDGLNHSNYNDNVKISVKTRIGIEELDEWNQILEVYNDFPFEEVIVHARLQKDFYNGHVHAEAFDYAVKNSKNPLCFNGDVKDIESLNLLYGKYDQVSIMIGRGAITNPAIFREIRANSHNNATPAELRLFHDKIYSDYVTFLGEKDALFKMKEVWYYLGQNYPEKEKALKAIKKTNSASEYLSAVRDIL